jgi:hypothetical protein
MNEDKLEKLLWSIAIPGFGHLLNGKFIKGTILIILEFLIDTNSNLNSLIMLSFNGKRSYPSYRLSNKKGTLIKGSNVTIVRYPSRIFK